MSRAYEAKKHALKAYPDDREKAVDLFLDYCDISELDFEYEFNESPEKYIFGDEGLTHDKQ